MHKAKNALGLIELCMKGMMKLPTLKQLVLTILKTRCLGSRELKKATVSKIKFAAAERAMTLKSETSKSMPLAELKIAHGKVRYMTMAAKGWVASTDKSLKRLKL